MRSILFACMGGYALLGQVLLVRELLVIFSGHELSIGMLFASWLGGIFAGAWCGGRLQARTSRPLLAFAAIQLAAVIAGPLLVTAIRRLRGLLHQPAGVPLPLLPTALASILLVASMSFFVGLLFPIACRMVSPVAGGATRAIGRVYVLEAAGSLAAGSLLTFLLLPRLDALQILGWGGLVIIAAVAAGLILEAPTAAAACGLLGFLWGLGLIGGPLDGLRDGSIRARWAAAHPGIQRLISRDSRYQSIELGKLGDQVSVFGNGHLLSTFPDPHGSAFMAHLVMCQRPRPQDLLILGGGPSSLLSLVLKYPVRTVHRVTLDPLVFRLSRPFLTLEERNARDDPRVRWSFMDGRYAVRKLPTGSLDALILQVPDPSTALLNRYHTIEFFLDLKRVLRKRGVVATSVTGSINYVGEEVGGYLGAIYWTLREVFPEVLLVPGDRVLLLASSTVGGLTLDPRLLSRRLASESFAHSDFPPDAFYSFIQEDRIRFWIRALNARRAPLNRDARPVGAFRYLTLWDLVSSRKYGQSPLKYLGNLQFEWTVFIWFALLLMYLLLPRKEGFLRTAPLLCIAVTGFSGMAQEIICLNTYQAAQGYLYSRLGLIVALFMAGLAGGGWMGMRWSTGDPLRAVKTLLGIQGFIWILCAAVAWLIVPLFLSPGSPLRAEGFLEAAVGLWMILTGAATGATFPLVCDMAIGEALDAARVAGQVDALDHLGAALGALIPGTFVIPILGVSQMGAILVVVQGSALALLGLHLLQRLLMGRH